MSAVLSIADFIAVAGRVVAEVLSLSLPVERLSEVVSDRVGTLVRQADSIKKDSQDAALRCSTLETTLDQLQLQKDGLLKENANPTMNALVELIEQIEALYKFVEDKKKAGMSPAEIFKAAAHLVTACKSQSHKVFTHFDSMHKKAKDVMAKSTGLSTDFTFQVTSAQTRLDKLQELERLAKVLKNGVEKEREYATDRLKTAKQHIQTAQETKRSAERARKSMQDARILRGILTLGIGELLDIGNLNRRIKDAEVMIRRAEENMQECERRIRNAAQDLQRVTGEIKSLETLGGSIRGQQGTLGQRVARTQGLRTTTIGLINSSLEVTLFLAILAAKSETVEINHTAQDFARGVLSFAKVMVAEGKVEGLLLERDPAALQETLNMIAQSGAEEDHAVQFNMMV